jgi:hypothetical protein
MSGTELKEGDWVVFDMKIGQIKKLGEFDEFSDGMFSTSGRLMDKFRPLNLRNKRIAETMEYFYRSLNKIDGERGFNYPDISRHFSQLTLDAIDGPDSEQMFDRAQDFVRRARKYKDTIDGVRLFRSARRYG